MEEKMQQIDSKEWEKLHPMPTLYLLFLFLLLILILVLLLLLLLLLVRLHFVLLTDKA